MFWLDYFFFLLLYGMTRELANDDRNFISGELIFNVPFNLEQR